MSIAKIAYFVSYLSLFSTGAMFCAERIQFSRLADFQEPLERINPDDDYGQALRCLFSERYWQVTADRQMRSDRRIYRLYPQMIPTVFEQRDKELVVRSLLAQYWIQEIKHEELANKSGGLLQDRVMALKNACIQKATERSEAQARRRRGHRAPFKKKSRA